MPPKKKPKGKPKGDAPGGGSGAPKTVGAMLAALGIADPASSFEACANFEEEFRVVKKAYLKIVLKEHPDKGGDRERFEAVQTAWETLSSMKAENKLGSLRSVKTASTSAAKEHAHAAAHRPSSTPDWSFYAEAFKESEIPLYKVERAKSGRSRCEMREKDATDTKKATKRRAYTVCRSLVTDKNSKCFIAKNHVRVGMMDVVSGAYGRFVHVECWRVPAAVYRGLPSPTVEKNVDAFKSAILTMEDVSLAGARALDDEGLTSLARHVMDPEHWARGAKKRLPDEPGAGAAAKKAKKAKSEPDAATVAAKKNDRRRDPSRKQPRARVCASRASRVRYGGPDRVVRRRKRQRRVGRRDAPHDGREEEAKGGSRAEENAIFESRRARRERIRSDEKKKKNTRLFGRRPAPRRRPGERLGVRRENRGFDGRVPRARRRRGFEPGQRPREGAHRVLRRAGHLRGFRKNGRLAVRPRAWHVQGFAGARARRDAAQLRPAVFDVGVGRGGSGEGLGGGARADGGREHHLLLLRVLGQRPRELRVGRRARVRGARAGAGYR
jgi:hypothetical protein